MLHNFSAGVQYTQLRYEGRKAANGSDAIVAKNEKKFTTVVQIKASALDCEKPMGARGSIATEFNMGVHLKVWPQKGIARP